MTNGYFRDAREWSDGLVNAYDSWDILQQAINDCIELGETSLYIPRGCKISKPLLMYKLYQGRYVGFNLEIFSDAVMWDNSNIPTIEALFNDTFILGIQLGKGCTIRNLNIKGKFTPPEGDSKTAYSRAFDDFKDGVSRDTRYSPYSGIVIDPFSNSATQIPSDGGYPGMTSFYQGTGGVGGSTATTIKDCLIQNTVVGICSSPNGFTRNAELTTIEHVQFKYNKLCISGGQDQEKANSVRNIACWYNSHTIFATNTYGAAGSGNWNIDTVNISGRVVRFVTSVQGGYFPLSIKNVFAESLGQWGFIQNNRRVVTKIEGCNINFALPNEAGIQTVISSQGKVNYDNCVFRYYGLDGVPLAIYGDATFEDCTFSGYPLLTGNYIYPRFIDCVANAAHLGLTGTKTFAGGDWYHPCGDFTLDNYIDVNSFISGGTYGLHNSMKFKTQDIYTTYTADTNVNVNVTNGTTTITSTDSRGYSPNFLVKVGTYLGVVTSTLGNNVTISYLPANMPSGVYNIVVYHPVYFLGILMGDITAGSNQILNCRMVNYWWFGLSNLIGNVIRNPFGGSKFIRITAVSGTTLTFYGTINTTKVGAVLGNYTEQEVYTDYSSPNVFAPGLMVRRGDKVIYQKSSENSIEHTVLNGGVLSPNDADPRKANLSNMT